MTYTISNNEQPVGYIEDDGTVRSIDHAFEHVVEEMFDKGTAVVTGGRQDGEIAYSIGDIVRPGADVNDTIQWLRKRDYEVFHSEKHVVEIVGQSGKRSCFRLPIPEIALAAKFLDAAVTAHLLGHKDKADQLIRMADMPEIKSWLASIWGKASPYVQYKPVLDGPRFPQTVEKFQNRMPSQREKQLLVRRDGYHCRFCGIPLIRAEVRKALKKKYPEALRWEGTIATQHSAFEAMWLQYDHILPHARGGSNDLDNLVITCAACNYDECSTHWLRLAWKILEIAHRLTLIGMGSSAY